MRFLGSTVATTPALWYDLTRRGLWGTDAGRAPLRSRGRHAGLAV